ncbi:DNA ligase [Alcanivorax sp. JB21]|uniref:DNA ligase n=1 Tax=Alcanivorax limicola TaxID=2874102 RepID=UPI001CBDC2C0|nr:DNA ligase [Alcanivorax limicola]MBZ2188916.1 DNA ligase [Alcanivorax limicola]
MVYLLLVLVLALSGVGLASIAHAAPPPVQLASVYDDTVYDDSTDLAQFWISEKLDGVRAYWNGTRLISRQGNVFAAPDWFIRDFPDRPLDGELWMGRGTFDRLSGTVRRQTPDESAWADVRFMVFDAPDMATPFDERVLRLRALLQPPPSAYIATVPQFRVSSQAALIRHLDDVVAGGGEGLMLHRGSARHLVGRSPHLLKLKPWQDAEAEVVMHLPGEGRNSDVMGAMLVRTEAGQYFRLGTGFTDAERADPPPVGSIVTYKYSGMTPNGIPRFASFLRMREPDVLTD